MVVQTIRLEQVYDIEAVKTASPRVPQSEVVPLAVALREVVRL